MSERPGPLPDQDAGAPPLIPRRAAHRRNIAIADEAAMATLGADIAAVLTRDDRIGLVGDLGAGKTTLARAIIRALAGDPALEVPSPTFTIVQHYEGRVPLRHVDLYRVEGSAALDELGLGEPDAAELIEWPTVALPTTLTIGFGAHEDARTITIETEGDVLDRLARQQARRAFLSAAGWADAVVTALKQDASTRSYDRLSRGEDRAVLMDAPSFTPGPNAYATKARLAHGNNTAFLAVGALLAARGLSTPAVLASDPATGFLLLEDFGDDKIVVAGKPVAERYLAAADALAAFHGEASPPTLPGAPPYTPPRFDTALGTFEVSLFPQWVLRAEVTPAYTELWRTALDGLWRGDDRLALRDYHSPNCLWLPDRQGVRRIGMIDFQDAFFAPSAFDVVSLAQDARVAIPQALEEAIVARYLAGRPGVDVERWRETYHIIGAERATRIAGVFRRLNDRDGKPHYLGHIRHVLGALRRNLLATPALDDLRAWFAANSDVMAAR